MENDIPHAKKGFMCPQFRKDMSKVCHTCGWWTGLSWKDPATQEVRSKWNCAPVITALGQVDVVRATAGVQAATESFRDAMVQLNVTPEAWRRIQDRADPKLLSN